MRQDEYLEYDLPNNETTSFRIGTATIPAPTFMPEIKGKEDIQILLKFSDAIPEGNPIIAPGNRLMQLITHPTIINMPIFGNGVTLRGFLSKHPLLLLDPPELFRNSYPNEFVKYALRGDRAKRRKFNDYLKKDENENAIELVPAFFRPFLRKQLQNVMKNLCPRTQSLEHSSPHVERAWLDGDIAKAYGPYIYEMAVNAQRMPNAALIPPVPPLMRSFDGSFASRVIFANKTASIACEQVSERNDPISRINKDVFPYFHLYIDWGVTQDIEGRGVASLIDVLEKGLERGTFAGVALTITGYEDAAKNRGLLGVEHLITEVVNICHSMALPVILPRSGWFGCYLTDLEIQAFGGLLNGNYKYPRGGGGEIKENKYGKVPLIDYCIDLKYNDTVKFLKEHGEFPFVNKYLPRIPDNKDLHNHIRYRLNFAKPLRLIHIEEARRLRVDKLKGIMGPAKHYFSKSEHLYLKNT